MASSMDDINDRARMLYDSGEYNSRTEAWRAAYQEALDEQSREHRAFVDGLPDDY